MRRGPVNQAIGDRSRIPCGMSALAHLPGLQAACGELDGHVSPLTAPNIRNWRG
jgi:hypothetical protein